MRLRRTGASWREGGCGQAGRGAGAACALCPGERRGKAAPGACAGSLCYMR